MKSKRSCEGYMLADHRACGGARVERATYTCGHCQRVVVLNPQRTRERAYCGKCDRRICDGCEAVRAASGKCDSFERRAGAALEAAARSLNLTHL